ncbi:hypothetical protein FB45DRAFT_760908, partial [Roridomyces roridus]
LVRPEARTSALARPLHVAMYEPDKPPSYFSGDPLACDHHSLFLIFMGAERPFLEGNQRTAFFIANEYLRAMVIPGLADAAKLGSVYSAVADIAHQHLGGLPGKSQV